MRTAETQEGRQTNRSVTQKFMSETVIQKILRRYTKHSKLLLYSLHQESEQQQITAQLANKC